MSMQTKLLSLTLALHTHVHVRSNFLACTARCCLLSDMHCSDAVRWPITRGCTVLQESIRDLLLTEGGARTAVEIQIREDGTGGICLAGAIERQVPWSDSSIHHSWPSALL